MSSLIESMEFLFETKNLKKVLIENEDRAIRLLRKLRLRSKCEPQKILKACYFDDRGVDDIYINGAYRDKNGNRLTVAEYYKKRFSYTVKDFEAPTLVALANVCTCDMFDRISDQWPREFYPLEIVYIEPDLI